MFVITSTNITRKNIIKEDLCCPSLWRCPVKAKGNCSLCRELTCSNLLQRVCVIGRRELPVL